MPKIGEIIRGLREDRDLKQADIAELLVTSQQYYSKYESGEFEIPTHHLITLSKFYDVSMDYIVGNTRFKRRFDVLETPITDDGATLSMLLERILCLCPSDRSYLVECVDLLEHRANCKEDKT